jgi:hypothetical protein
MSIYDIMSENFKKLIRLSEENKGLEIIAEADEKLYSGEYGWCIGSIGDSKVCYYWVKPDDEYDGERVYLDDEIYDQIYDELYYFLLDNPERDFSKEKIEEMTEAQIEKKKKCGEIKKAIFVEIIERQKEKE